MKRFLKVLAVLLLTGCWVTACNSDQDSSAGQTPIPLVGMQAPDFKVKDVFGKRVVDLSELRGKVVVLDFWATWCPPCRAEIPHFIQMAIRLKSKGVRFVGVSVDQGGARVVRAFASQWKINYPVLVDPGDLAFKYGQIHEIPTTFLIGEKGVILKRYVGYHDPSEFEADILSALRQNG